MNDGGDLGGDLELSIRGVTAGEREDGALDVQIGTSRGLLNGILHPREAEPGAALFVGGALGGLDGPANAIYPRLAKALVREGSGMTSLRLHYREPGEFQECVLDVMAGLSVLKGIGATRAVLVGHSFGAAVVIKAGELSELVAGVASLSPQTYGTRTVQQLGPKPLLLAHGTHDSILDCEASRDIYRRASEPKRLVLYEDAGHSLASCADKLFELLLEWLPETVGATAGREGAGKDGE